MNDTPGYEFAIADDTDTPTPRKPFMDAYLKEIYGLGGDYRFSFVENSGLRFLLIRVKQPEDRPDAPGLLVPLEEFLTHAFKWETHS